MRFYCGTPLVASNGHRLGTLCFADNEPHSFDAERCNILNNMAELCVREIERDQAMRRQSMESSPEQLVRSSWVANAKKPDLAIASYLLRSLWATSGQDSCQLACAPASLLQQKDLDSQGLSTFALMCRKLGLTSVVDSASENLPSSDY